jgi:hypothetical protein
MLDTPFSNEVKLTLACPLYHLATILAQRPLCIQPPLVLIGLDETDMVIFWDFRADPVFYFLVYDEALCQFLAYIVLALRTVV